MAKFSLLLYCFKNWIQILECPSECFIIVTTNASEFLSDCLASFAQSAVELTIYFFLSELNLDGYLSLLIWLFDFQEMYTQAGPQFRDELNRHHLPSSMVKI